MSRWKTISESLIFRNVAIAPLVTFRIFFGLLMLISIIRFAANGWIKSLYIDPQFFFPFVEGLAPIEGQGMYLIFFLMGLAALLITLGYFYRIATLSFFLLFTYVELIDKTNYLNHYYFVSIVSFLLIWLPAHRRFSLDIWRNAVKARSHVAIGYINVLKLQLAIVYFFAGIAKINYDWLINAQPLKLWLSAQTHKPLIGWIFKYKLTAYFFSWFGMIYDVTIPFFLAFKKTLPYAYFFVVAFHLMTWWLFPIGMFPFIMIIATTIFFPSAFHEKILRKLETMFKTRGASDSAFICTLRPVYALLFALFFALQIILPLRFLTYPGNVFWNEAGYRFSWRVMLMEKAGHATFYVTEGDKKHMVANYEYLTPQQEKMMATQPDMIVQFAKFLKEEYKTKGFTDPQIQVESFVTLNGRPNKRFIDPSVDVASKEMYEERDWVLAYE